MKLLKLWSASVLLAALASPLGAEFVTVGINFYTSGEGDLTRIGKLPAGVTVMAKKKFDNPKLKGFCRYIVLDLDKCTSVDLKFAVAGKGQIFPSVSAWKGKIGASSPAKVKCLKFEFNDEVQRWRHLHKEWYDRMLLVWCSLELSSIWRV